MNRTIGLISTNYSVPGFGSVTEVRPAASIPFGGRYRLLDFALSNMVNSRVQTVGLVTPYFYRSIMDHVGAGKPWDLSRKEGGLYILPGTVFGFHEENARFLFRDLLHNLEYLRQGDGDYILVSSGTLVANIDYQPMITKHELEGKPVTLLYKKMQPGEKRPGRYLTLDSDTVAGIRRADEGETSCLTASSSISRSCSAWRATMPRSTIWIFLTSSPTSCRRSPSAAALLTAMSPSWTAWRTISAPVLICSTVPSAASSSSPTGPSEPRRTTRRPRSMPTAPR